MHNAAGNVTVLVLGLIASAVAIGVGVGRIGVVAVAARNAELAADAAALAGGDELALGGSCSDALAQAEDFARRNDAIITRTICTGSSLQVTVRVRGVTRTAHAVVADCWWCQGDD